MRDSWTDRLSEYVDGELGADEKRELDRHLADCGSCARALAALREIVARARSLEERGPERDLWPGIAARLGPAGDEGGRVLAGTRFGAGAGSTEPPAARTPERRGRRSISLTWPQLAAAGLAIMLFTAAATWMVRSGWLERAAGQAGLRDGSGAAQLAGSRAVSHEVTIAELRRALLEDRDKLDPATVRVLERNLNLIEQSIDQARRALAADPGNPYLKEHLEKTMRRKLELLRQATVLASAP